MEKKYKVTIDIIGNHSYYNLFAINDTDRSERILASLPKYKNTYDSFVNAIIEKEYPSDKMQAIINNYLLDSKDKDAKKEFNEMQEYRAYAKEAAKECIKYIKENNLEYGESSENN